MNDLVFFFRSLKGCFYCIGRLGEIGLPSSFVALAFRNGLVYRNADGCINSDNDIQLHQIKFGKLWSSNLGVYDNKICKTGVDRYLG